MSFQMCPNFINTPFNNIPIDKCFPSHLQTGTFQYLPFFITYLYILFVFLIIYTNLLNHILVLIFTLTKYIIQIFFYLFLNFSFSNLSLLLLSNLSLFKSFLISNFSYYTLSIFLLFLDFILYFLDFLYEFTHSTILFLLSLLSFYKHNIELIVNLKNTLNSQ
jgi:hypothetical protein